MRKLLPIILTGFGTDPESEADNPGDQPTADCGMLGIAEEFRDQLPEFEVMDAVAFSWNGDSVDNLVAAITGAIEFARLGKGDAVVMQGHSFGNNPAVVWSNRMPDLSKRGPTVIYIGHDPCHEHIRYLGKIQKWALGEAVNAALVHYQRKGRPAGVDGTPFDERDNQAQIDVSEWGGPPLGHINCISIEGFPPKIVRCTGIIMDSRVRAAIHAAVRGVLIEGRTVKDVIDRLSAKWHAEHAVG